LAKKVVCYSNSAAAPPAQEQASLPQRQSLFISHHLMLGELGAIHYFKPFCIKIYIMYPLLEKAFEDSPGKRKVAEAILRYGLRVDESGRIFCADIELSPAKMARALGVDRRVVIETGRMIAENDELYNIFSQLLPTAFLGRVADKLGFESIEIRAEPHQKGIVAKVTEIIAGKGIGIRQIVADDPDIYPEPKLTLILEKKLDGATINRLRGIKGVREIVIR